MELWRTALVMVFVHLCYTSSTVNARFVDSTTSGTLTTTVETASSTLNSTTVTEGTTAPTANGTTIVTTVTTATAPTTNGTTAGTTAGTTSAVNLSNITITTADSANATVSDIKILDLTFIMDTTGSMGSYIHSARNNIRTLVDEIAVNSSTDLRVALIEYRDHPPQESSFVTRTHDFTSSVKTMKSWLNQSQARGGGDGPESVADGLHDVTKLSWRPEAAKISVLISDAPPHGLVPWEDMSFPEGCPDGHDPVEIARIFAKREITLYTVGCEPSINQYKEFFVALAYLTGGQYIPLLEPKRLIDAIIGGAQEELSLQKFSKDVEAEIKRITSLGETVNETVIAASVYNKLQKEGATSKQLFRNNKPLEGASDFAKSLAASPSMSELRMAYGESRPKYSSGDRGLFRRGPVHDAVLFSDVSERKSPGPYELSEMSMSESMPAHDGAISEIAYAAPLPGAGAAPSRGSGADSSSSAGEAYSTVESAVSLDQIERLVRKKTAKLSVA